MLPCTLLLSSPGSTDWALAFLTKAAGLQGRGMEGWGHGTAASVTGKDKSHPRLNQTHVSLTWACIWTACPWETPSLQALHLVASHIYQLLQSSKWAQKQLPAPGRGVRSGANSDRCHLPNFPVNDWPGRWGTLIRLLCLLQVRHHSEDTIMQKGRSINSSFAVFSLLGHTVHTLIRNTQTCLSSSRSR